MRVLNAWTPVKQLECSVPANAENYDQQLCGWQTAVDDITGQAGILVDNLGSLMDACKEKNHKPENEECSCEIRANQIAVLCDFFGLELK